MKLLLLILSAFAVVHSGPLLQDYQNETFNNPVNSNSDVFKSLIKKFEECAKNDLILCLKENALKATEMFNRVREFKIFDGVVLHNNNPKKGRSLEFFSPLPTEPRARDKQITERLLKSASELIQSSDLGLSYPTTDEEDDSDVDADADSDADADLDADADADTDEEEANADSDEADESRGKKKKKKKKKKREHIKKKLKILIPLILFAKIKGILLVIFSIVLIAKSTFKLALLAKIAFLIKMFSALKAHLSKKPEKEGTYEVSHSWEPEHIHFEHGPEWEGGWSRSRNKSNNMAYLAQVNNNNNHKDQGFF